MRRFFWGVLAAVLAVSGCSSKPPPIMGPPFSLMPDAMSADRPDQMLTWGEWVGLQHWKRYECAALSDHPGVAVCLFAHSYEMNRIFANAVARIEAPAHADGDRNITGIDLRLDDLERYWERGGGLNAEQDYFRQVVLPQLRHSLGARAVIATGWGNQSTLEHELLHARYFSDPAYVAAVTEFWQDRISAPDRDRFRAELAVKYNGSDQDLIINEFQAYVLQSNPSNWLLEARRLYRTDLLRHLETKGLSPRLLSQG